MSFRQYGGINYAARNNIVKNNFTNARNLSIMNKVGQPDSKINVESTLDVYAINLTSPIITTNQNGLVPKSYVDLVTVGLKPLQQCQCATTGPLTPSGDPSSTTYATPLVIDGYTVKNYDRVLIKDQQPSSTVPYSGSVQNGIYVFTTTTPITVGTGTFTRASDYAYGTDAYGAYTLVQTGVINGNKQFIELNQGDVGVDPLLFTTFTASFDVGQGLEKISTGSSTIVQVKSDLSTSPGTYPLPFITTLAVSGATTVGSLTVNGNLVVGGVITGNGSGITNISNAAGVTLSNTASGPTNYLVMSTTPSGPSSLLTDIAGATYDSTSNTAVINITGNAATATTSSACGGNAATANTATNSTNLIGGSAGQIPYQVNTSTTSFSAVGAVGQVLTSQGTAVPTWSNSSSGTGLMTTFVHTQSNIVNNPISPISVVLQLDSYTSTTTSPRQVVRLQVDYAVYGNRTNNIIPLNGTLNQCGTVSPSNVSPSFHLILDLVYPPTFNGSIVDFFVVETSNAYWNISQTYTALNGTFSTFTPFLFSSSLFSGLIGFVIEFPTNFSNTNYNGNIIAVSCSVKILSSDKTSGFPTGPQTKTYDTSTTGYASFVTV